METTTNKWRSVLAVVLWAVSAALGLVDLAGLHQMLRLCVELSVRVDPMNTVGARFRMIGLERWGILLLGLAWLVSTVVLFAWYDNAKVKRTLLSRFLKLLAAQVAILTVGYALP